MPQNKLQQLEEVVDLGQRLGRHVEHDIRSAEYAIEVDLSKPLVSTTHERKIPILDQGNLGSCTGNAGTGLLGTEPFYSEVGHLLNLDEAFAIQLYSDATVADGYPGDYPPDDTGSSGLAIGKVLRKRGDIASYRHAFGLLHSLQALAHRPLIIGVPWFSSMDRPDSNGVVKVDPNSGIRGGHEIELLAMDVTNGDPNEPAGMIRLANSWGISWASQGYFEMSFGDFDTLLKHDGDVMTFTLKAA